MVVNFCFVVNRAGALLASRFYDGSPAAARLDWQQIVYQAIVQTFPTLRDDVQLAVVKYDSLTTIQ